MWLKTELVLWIYSFSTEKGSCFPSFYDVFILLNMTKYQKKDGFRVLT
nr:MAG TPA: hypothetical protein [Caudoviricetes sp.]